MGIIRQATAHLQSMRGSPYQQSAAIMEKKHSNELDEDFEARIWRQRAHVDATGHMVIPPMQFTKSFHEAASYYPIKIPGQRNRTFTKHLQNGVMVLEGLPLSATRENVEGRWVFAGSQGVGSSKRVMKCYPTIPKWEGDITYLVMDDIITEDIFLKVLLSAGLFIGIGTYRPSAPAHGFHGRYTVVGDVRWETMMEI